MENAIYFLSASFIRAVEEMMDWYDHLAFVLLLSKRGDECIAVEWMQRLIWLREQGSPDWRRVAVNLTIQSAGMNPNAVTEALFQLKQWKLLCLIGYTIPVPIHFVPTGHLCPFRVGLFGILDQLDYNHARILIYNMGGTYGFQEIEVAALQWILKGIISKNNCSKLTVSLSLIGRSDLAILSLQLQAHGVARNPVLMEVPAELNNFNEIATIPSTSDGLLSRTSSGYCLIVHQKTFYQERDPMLKQVELQLNRKY